jgi:hypothetical protein
LNVPTFPASPPSPPSPPGAPAPGRPGGAGFASGGGSPGEEIFGNDVASWNDFSGVANAARVALQTAARIEIPGPWFVIVVLAGYLLVLVPLNWIVFRVAGRVEWAWVAAPLIALVCTAVVIRLAQLDIGFVRSVTELAVVEIQGEYPRAHVTRYTAVYTSLSTRYNVRAEDPGAQVQPFPSVDDPKKLRALPGQRYTRLQYTFGQDVTLRGFAVSSNSTGLVHSEQMLSTGGIALGQTAGGLLQVTNHTGLALEEAGVVIKDSQGNVETAWLAQLAPEATARLQFQPWNEGPEKGSGFRAQGSEKGSGFRVQGSGIVQPNPEPRTPNLEGSDPFSSLRSNRQGDRSRLNLGALFPLACAPAELAPGEMRLVAWAEAELPGLAIEPAAPQAQHRALVVAHLRPAALGQPKPDANSRTTVDHVAPRTLRDGG